MPISIFIRSGPKSQHNKPNNASLRSLSIETSCHIVYLYDPASNILPSVRIAHFSIVP